MLDANIFYPSRNALAYSDHQLLQSLSVWPVYAMTHNVTLCYNVVLLVSLVLSAWAMYAFVHTITGSTLWSFASPPPAGWLIRRVVPVTRSCR